MEIDLLDAQGSSVLQQPWSCDISVPGGDQKTLEVEIPVSNPEKWSAEYPYLYKLLFIIKDDQGQVQEVIPSRVGFRNIELRDGNFLVNGVPIMIKNCEPPRSSSGSWKSGSSGGDDKRRNSYETS